MSKIKHMRIFFNFTHSILRYYLFKPLFGMIHLFSMVKNIPINCFFRYSNMTFFCICRIFCKYSCIIIKILIFGFISYVTLVTLVAFSSGNISCSSYDFVHLIECSFPLSFVCLFVRMSVRTRVVFGG